MSFFKKSDTDIIEKERALIEKEKEHNLHVIQIQKEKLKLLEEKKELKNLRSERVELFNKLKAFDKFSLTYYKNLWNNKFNPSLCFLVNMRLQNGFCRTYLIKTSKNSFKINNKEFVIDEELKYYDSSLGYYCYDYHENFSLPFKNTVEINDIKEGVENSGITDVETAINPSTLRRFITSEVIEKVLKGTELDDVFKFIKLFLILIFIGVAICVVILLQTSGILSAINL